MRLPLLLLSLVLSPNIAVAEVASNEQTRVAWTKTCPHDVIDAKGRARSGLLGAALLALAPKLIEGGVDAASNALKAAGESKSTSSSAKSTGNFYSVTSKGDLILNYGCVVIVRGDFTNPVDQARVGLYSSIAGLESLKSSSFEFEAKIESLKGLKFVRLKPLYLKSTRFADTSWFSKSERAFTIAISMDIPGGEQPFGSAQFTFAGIEEGKEYKTGAWQFANADSAPFALAPESADATSARTKRQGDAAPYLIALDIMQTEQKARASKGEAASPEKVPSLYANEEVRAAVRPFCSAVQNFNAMLPDASKAQDERCKYVLEAVTDNLDRALGLAHTDRARLAWATKTCGDIEIEEGKEARCSKFNPSPDVPAVTFFSTSATLVETRPGNKFLKFLGGALGAAKTEVSATIGERILPRTAKQRELDDAASRDGRRGIVLADLQVVQAEETFASAVLEAKPADVTAARIALVKAKIAANDAYRKAGSLVIPFPELD